ncbi:ATP-binding protein [Paenibacillus gansuensis]|uniref:histidine kinase n=1 Tax=Paenibacillus gansuensis TaxID=306542 RepID=A0ABW5P878_9BACL
MDNLIAMMPQLLLTLSVVFLTCYATMEIADRILPDSPRRMKIVYMTCTSIVFGFGMWCMHFISLVHLPIALTYNLKAAVIALAVAALSSTIPVYLIYQASRIPYSSFLAAASLCMTTVLIHISGMSAVSDHMRYDLPRMLMYCSGGMILIYAALRFIQQRGFNSNRLRIALSSFVTAVALTGIHYAGLPPHREFFHLYHKTPVPLMGQDEFSILLSAVYFLLIGIVIAALSGKQSLMPDKAPLASAGNCYKALYYNNPDLVLEIDLHGRLVDSNNRLTEVTDYTKEEVMGRSISDFLLPGAGGWLEQLLLRRLDTTQHKEVTILLNNGSKVHWDVSAIPMKSEEGMVCGFLLTCRTNREIGRGKQRYLELQSSLDTFSGDLFGVTHIADIQSRLIREVRQVLGADKVYVLIRKEYGYEVLAACGKKSLVNQEELKQLGEQPVMEQLVDMNHGHLLQLGKIKGDDAYLWIHERLELLALEPYRVWLRTLARYVMVLFDNFRVIEDLSSELSMNAANTAVSPWFLRLLFNLSENERVRLAADLHDTALQEQIVWYRKLEAIASRNEIQHLEPELNEVTEGLLDVIYQIRLVCYELRPPFLKEMGIVAALSKLYEDFQLRTDLYIQFTADSFESVLLTDDLVTGLYRINQELLNNAAKHSKASLIKIRLFRDEDRVSLKYEDNGIGFDMAAVMHLNAKGMGIYGIKERVRSLEGELQMESLPGNGMNVDIRFPMTAAHTYITTGG